MERGKRSEKEASVLKTTLVVLGGLALSWLTMETAFKPYLDRIRGTIDKSDPDHDSDSDYDDAKGEPSTKDDD